MNINDYGELNALNKLLGKIKFQSDLDFSEFKEFASSSIIADIFKRVNDELWEESIKRGYIKQGQKPAFEFDSPTGKTICKRIDELTDNDCETLRKSGSQQIDKYLKVLISPLQVSDKDFDLLRKYAEKRII